MVSRGRQREFDIGEDCGGRQSQNEAKKPHLVGGNEPPQASHVGCMLEGVMYALVVRASVIQAGRALAHPPARGEGLEGFGAAWPTGWTVRPRIRSMSTHSGTGL